MKPIEEMAREARLPEAWISETGVLKWSELERFAELVRAEAQAEEREAVIEWVRNNYQDHNIASLCDAIRARGNT